MTLKQRFAILGGVGLAFVAYVWFVIHSSEIAIGELYPGVPKRTINAAHRKMLKDVVTGKTELGNSATDDEIKHLFETHYLDPINGR